VMAAAAEEQQANMLKVRARLKEEQRKEMLEEQKRLLDYREEEHLVRMEEINEQIQALQDNDSEDAEVIRSLEARIAANKEQVGQIRMNTKDTIKEMEEGNRKTLALEEQELEEEYVAITQIRSDEAVDQKEKDMLAERKKLLAEKQAELDANDADDDNDKGKIRRLQAQVAAAKDTAAQELADALSEDKAARLEERKQEVAAALEAKKEAMLEKRAALKEEKKETMLAKRMELLADKDNKKAKMVEANDVTIKMLEEELEHLKAGKTPPPRPAPKKMILKTMADLEEAAAEGAEWNILSVKQRVLKDCDGEGQWLMTDKLKFSADPAQNFTFKALGDDKYQITSARGRHLEDAPGKLFGYQIRFTADKDFKGHQQWTIALANTPESDGRCFHMMSHTGKWLEERTLDLQELEIAQTVSSVTTHEDQGNFQMFAIKRAFH